jgi:ABC-2 type transport system ATP-binding protein
MPSEYVIETEQLQKIYGKNVAVRGLDLQVARGEIFGFLGPNGAGKTTAIKMLLGLVQPTSGHASLLGEPIGNPDPRRKVGFLPEHFRFQEWLTASEFLSLHGQLCGLDRDTLVRLSGIMLERVGLSEHRDHQLSTFSKGMLQRIGLAQALINQPRLVFLDEPTSGLDPVGRMLVRDLINELRADGTAVFLNSHFLSEVEITCDRVAFIKHGEVIRKGNLQELIGGETTLSIQIGEAELDALKSLEQFGSSLHINQNKITMTIENGAVIPQITRCLTSKNIDIYAITPRQHTLEERFIEILGMDGGL